MSLNNIFDDHKLTITCKCGHKFDESIQQLKTNPKFTCAKCGTIINIDASELNREIKKLADVLKRMGFKSN